MGGCFCCEDGRLSVSKGKGNGHFMGERNRTVVYKHALEGASTASAALNVLGGRAGGGLGCGDYFWVRKGAFDELMDVGVHVVRRA